MYLDISSNQGKIDWKTLAENNRENINGVILRATTQNNKLDVRTIENYNGILHNMSDIDEISVYKFSYARDYVSARVECMKCLQELSAHGVHFDFLYLDLEGWGGRDYTREEANAVILAYWDVLDSVEISSKLRLYFNYNYLKNIIDPIWRKMPIWLARYNSTMGDIFDANIVLWQYTSTGKIDGIKGNVDLSKEIKQ
jgi:GH25 family lysozyme M1 (1,4-beta-N-acetylmuramidase)